MKFRAMYVILTLAAAACLIAADSSDSAKVMMEAARKKEVVDGDLNGAIKQYAAIAAKYAKTDRATAAMALVYEAEAYQKLGDTQAKKIFEQVVKDYGEQKDAVAVAKSKLGSGGTSSVTQTLVWSMSFNDSPIFPNSISADGALVAYLSKGEVYIRDLHTRMDRKVINLPNGSNEAAQAPLISPDGKQVSYRWRKGPAGAGTRADLRISNITGDPNPRVLYDNPDLSWIYPYAWSPDGKFIAAEVQHLDNSRQIGLITVPEGSFRVLQSIDWRGSQNAAFSPDGRYLAYDLPQSDTGEARDIHVIAVDGTRGSSAVVHPSDDQIVGWSPDGKSLVFTSDRTGTIDLWSVDIVDGKTKGDPRLLKSSIAADFSTVGITRSGTLYYRGTVGGAKYKAQIASVDLANGKLVTTSVNAAEEYLHSSFNPVWSPDGTELAYQVERTASDSVIAIRSVESGKISELRPKLSEYGLVSWIPNGRSLLLDGFDAQGRRGLFRTDVETGNVSLVSLSNSSFNLRWAPDGRSFLVEGTGSNRNLTRIDIQTGDAQEILPVQAGQGNFGFYAGWSRDGKKVYFRRVFKGGNGATQDSAAMELDLVSKTQREVLRGPFVGPAHLTADGQYIVTEVSDSATNSRLIMLVPTAGGNSRELMRVPSGVNPDSLTKASVGRWPYPVFLMPDGRMLLVREQLTDQRGASEIWAVPLDGGQPKKISDIPASFDFGSMAVSPDGSHLAYALVDRVPQALEFWALENFLPKASN